MALASKMPTQMGRTAELEGSRRMMIGMLVIGSIINLLIFISSSMAPIFSPLQRLYPGLPGKSSSAGRQRFANQRGGVGPGDSDLQERAPARRGGEMHDPVATCPALREAVVEAAGPADEHLE